NRFYDSRENCNAIIETATNTLIKGCPTTIIPNGVERIATNAFDNYDSLYELTIPESVTFLAENFVLYCNNLKRINVAKGEADFYREMVSDLLKPLIVEE
ncbi:MAG: leucine-rich repeat protein, partial [Bacteroidales bacterium]|nr:leucine-rich repeat protein [Bacteroidales bacterium]